MGCQTEGAAAATLPSDEKPRRSHGEEGRGGEGTSTLSWPLAAAAAGGAAASSSLSASAALASSRRKGARGSEADHTLSTAGGVIGLREELSSALFPAEKERKRGRTGPGCGLPSYGALSDCGGEGAVGRWGGRQAGEDVGRVVEWEWCVCA